MPMSAHDTIVVGAGQAGLAMSYHLTRLGRDHLLLERARVADRWHNGRWDSLRFQLPNWSLALPGLAYDAPDPDGYAHCRDVAAFIERYARHIAAPVRTGVEVSRLQAGGDGFKLETSSGGFTARHVVVATGPFQRPLVPKVAAGLPAGMLQLPAAAYRNPGALPPGAVLVVGSGASGCQIAEELLAAGRTVYLSVGRHRRVPRRYRGRDVYWWLGQLGRLAVTIDSFPAGGPPSAALITGINGGYDVDIRRFAAGGGIVLGHFRGADAGRLSFDGNAEQVLAEADASYADFVRAMESHVAANGLDLPPAVAPVAPSVAAIEPIPELDAAASGIGCVIWATGYAYDYGWIDIDMLDGAGAPRQQRGVTSCPGLYFLGLHWMHTVTSGLLAGVGDDAAYIAGHIARKAPLDAADEPA
jgi:putative flavoprotein involved in K+ transport